jgi:hypothetical protein
MHPHGRFTLIVAIGILNAALSRTQSSSRPEFEVASIKGESSLR